jgi:hypothetical protein
VDDISAYYASGRRYVDAFVAAAFSIDDIVASDDDRIICT